MATTVQPQIHLPAVSLNELNAILAGLRALQYLLDTNTLPPAIRTIHIDNGNGLGLTAIDSLYERLNCG